MSLHITVLQKTTILRPTLGHLPGILITGGLSENESVYLENKKKCKSQYETPLPPLSVLGKRSKRGLETRSGETSDHDSDVKEKFYKTLYPEGTCLRSGPFIRCEEDLIGMFPYRRDEGTTGYSGTKSWDSHKTLTPEERTSSQSVSRIES